MIRLKLRNLKTLTDKDFFRFLRRSLRITTSFPYGFNLAKESLKKFFSLLSGFSFKDTDDSQDSKGRDGTIFYSTLPLPSAHEHSDIYFSTLHVKWPSHIWHHISRIDQSTTRWDLPPYRITIWVIDDVMLRFVCLLVDLIQGFCYSYLKLETAGLELAATITLVLQANRLTRYASESTNSLAKWKLFILPFPMSHWF